MDKIPPHDNTIEQSILGVLLLDADSILHVADSIVPDAFYTPANRIIYEAIIDVYNKKQPIDMLTCVKQLRAMNKLDECGGALYVGALTNRVVSSVNIGTWVAILNEMYLRRNVATICSQYHNATFDLSQDIFDTFDSLNSTLSNTMNSVASTEVVHVSGLLSEALAGVEARYNNATAMSGVSSGIRSIDSIIGGWQKSDLIYLAARPAMGKTACAISQALHIAMTGKPVAIFSLEMSYTQVIYRLLSIDTGLSSEKLMKQKLSQDELSAFYVGLDRIKSLPIYIDDTPALSVHTLRTKCRKLKDKKGIEAVFIDYVQLMTAGNLRTNGMSREQEISTISRNLKLIAKECNIPVIALSQLSRSLESRTDRRPILSDLRESGSLEQDADIVCFLFRPEYYGITEDADGVSTSGLGEFIVAKQRNGQTGIATMQFHHSTMHYTDRNVHRSHDDILNNRWDLNEAF